MLLIFYVETLGTMPRTWFSKANNSFAIRKIELDRMNIDSAQHEVSFEPKSFVFQEELTIVFPLERRTSISLALHFKTLYRVSKKIVLVYRASLLLACVFFS